MCDEGFTGTACERSKLELLICVCFVYGRQPPFLTIPRTICYSAMCKNTCCSTGQWVSVSHLAQTTRNHESRQYTYNLWDADKIYGCICDLGFTGYDCSLRVCPSGDDPLTTGGSAQEVQLLRCSADNTSGGKILLYFDGRPSTVIPVDASAVVLKTALETIPLIEEVDVTYSEGSLLCRDDGVDNVVQITFVSNFGPL